MNYYRLMFIVVRITLEAFRETASRATVATVAIFCENLLVGASPKPGITSGQFDTQCNYKFYDYQEFEQLDSIDATLIDGRPITLFLYQFEQQENLK